MTKAKLLEKQAAMRARQLRKPRTGRPDKTVAAQLRCRRRVTAYLMLQNGRSPAEVASLCSKAFGTQWTAEDVQNWVAKGCPLC